MKCPHCGHTIEPKPKRAECWQPAADVDTSTLTRDQLYAHYKQTAPVQDVRFFAAHCGIPTIRNQAIALEYDALNTTIKRAEVYRRLTALQDQWRRETSGYVAPNETAYWQSVRIVNRRIQAKAYRERQRNTLSTIRHAAARPMYSWRSDGYSSDSVALHVRDLVQAARKLAPNAAAFRNETRYRDAGELAIRKAS